MPLPRRLLTVLCALAVLAGLAAYAGAFRGADQRLPGGGTKIFGNDRFLIAHYGFAHPSTTMVLGEHSPDAAFRAMTKQGAKFQRKGEQVLPVYELIVTIADADPGTDGNYNHDLVHSKVQEYIDAAHRNKALLLLDLQPGRESFLTVARRWEWALQDPWVGLALDPEWRMKATQVPGRDIGSVTAKEINRTSGWLARLTARERLPQKLFLFHQYKAGNVTNIGKVKRRDQVAVVQHIDAAGSPAAKAATYRALAKPRRFTTGFMVFLDIDSPRMKPKAIRALGDSLRFVSYQ